MLHIFDRRCHRWSGMARVARSAFADTAALGLSREMARLRPIIAGQERPRKTVRYNLVSTLLPYIAEATSQDVSCGLPNRMSWQSPPGEGLSASRSGNQACKSKPGGFAVHCGVSVTKTTSL